MSAWTDIWGRERLDIWEPEISRDSHGAPHERYPRVTATLTGVDIQAGGSVQDTAGRTFQSWDVTAYVDGMCRLHPRSKIEWRGGVYTLASPPVHETGVGLTEDVTVLRLQRISEGA